MVAQGRGGRIIGAFPFSHLSLFLVLKSIFRGLFWSRKTGSSSLPFALYHDEAHLARTAIEGDSAYSASKFAIRGLTQSAGTPLGEINGLQYSSADG
jgi:hypothetical protein